MSIYKYRIKSLKSEEGTESGLVEASSKEQAASILEDKGFVVLFLEKKKKGLANIEDFLTRIKIKDLVIFSRQLSILISAEVPLVRALRNVVEQTP
ncbi:MAG TPA: type II secretion system F family protein, partial [Patescibacteria group bacterium]|nr:type II secretion system F family protein [Patescibacteria group bacterium]